MTIANMIREVFAALEWSVNSEIVFAVVAIVTSIPIIYYALGVLWRFLRRVFIFLRGSSDE